MAQSSARMGGEVADVGLRRALRPERTMLRIRWIGVGFGLIQVFTYYIPHPPGALAAALAFIVLLAAGNVGVMVALRRVTTLRGARILALAALSLDIVVVMGLVFVYTFDPDTAIFAIVYILALEGAVRFQLLGALGTMTVAAVLYTVRETYGWAVYGNDFLLTSISFRMGIGFIIAGVAGAMANSLVGEREDAERLRGEAELHAAQLADANRELQAANQVKDDFVAMTNHELRTPLTTILGYTRMLQKRWGVIPDPQRLEFVRRIEQQGQRLLALVEGLLTISSGQAGALNVQLEPVAIRSVVLTSLEECGLTPAEVPVSCDPDIRALADPGWLRQILTNYLTNATKYGAPPFAVEVRRVEPWVQVTVSDAGEGVPESFAPRLFERFSQASRGDSRTAAGTGLGLAIVAQLAEAQGGQAWYEANSPRGSRFSVRLLATAGFEPAAEPGEGRPVEAT
jgi:signal transduction histidine kinase